MSNSTRQGGYDERLVVPLEASRRGAHRARANPLFSALPLLAVVLVVAAVIGVAYTLFVKPTNTADTGDQSLPTLSSPPAATSAPAGAPSSSGRSSSGPASSSQSAGTSSSSAGTVDKASSFRMYNGSVAQTPGLGRRAAAALKSAGWSGAQIEVKGVPVAPARTTRIYYATSSQRATAEALQRALGVGVVKQSSTIAASGIVVVVGDDYQG